MNKVDFPRMGLHPLFRLCNPIRWLLIIFLWAHIMAFILSWVIPMPLDVGPVQIQFDPDGMTEGAVRGLSALQKTAGIVIGLPGLAALTYGMVQLSRTLGRLQRGQIFALDTIAHLRASAGAILLTIILFTLEQPLRSIAFNLLDRSKTYPVSVDVTSSELLLILVCGLFNLIVGVMHEGRRLREENEGFI